MLERKDELIGFCIRQTIHHQIVDIVDSTSNFGHECLALIGEVNLVKSPIGRIWSATDEVGLHQFVDDPHHGSFVDAEIFDQILLCNLACFGVEPQQKWIVFARYWVLDVLAQLSMILLEDHSDAAA